MVKIRYSELPAGLHVTAETQPPDTVVYLQSGLTPAQRRDALIRVRRSARMGQGPALSALAMARAIAADRVRTAARIGAAAMRRRPMLILPPLAAVVFSAVVFLCMSAAPLPGTGHGKSPAVVPTLGVDAGQTPGPAGHSQTPRDASGGAVTTRRAQQYDRLSSAPASGT